MISERRKEIVEYRKKYPCFTLAKIGNEFGISRQRVKQILDLEGAESKHYTPAKYCPNCDKPIVGRNKSKQIFCNNQCRSEYTHILLICPVCNKYFTVRQCVVKYCINKRNQQKFFCSNKCKGIYNRGKKINERN